MLKQWIDERATLAHTKIEMRTGREPGTADTTDQLALYHTRTPSDTLRERRQVQIVRLVAVRMPQTHHIAGTATFTRRDDRAVRDRDDWCSDRGPIVNPEMRSASA